MRPTRYPSRARALLCEGNSSSCFRSYSVTRAHVLLAAALRLVSFRCSPHPLIWRLLARRLFFDMRCNCRQSCFLLQSVCSAIVFLCLAIGWLFRGCRMHNLRERRAIRRPPRACLLRGWAVVFRRRTFFYKNVIDG